MSLRSRSHLCTTSHWAAVLLLLSGMSAVGCKPQTFPPTSFIETHTAHPSTGPHGGHLIELGGEEYHVEFLHNDQSGEVTFIILDGSGRIEVPVNARNLLVNVRHNGRPEQFRIPAAPNPSEPTGMSSHFVSVDQELAADLNSHNVDAWITVTIQGRQFTGKIEHEHGEQGHSSHNH